MPETIATLQALRASTADLLQGLDAEQWSDADVAAPSLCEGWTRGHVLTHIARNADGITATLAGALRGEIVARYPDGWDARNEAIAAGATRPVTELRADVQDSADRLDRVLGAIGDADGWQRPTDQDHPAQHWVHQRWREVEIHRVDLAGAYTPDRWPALLVTEVLVDVAATLADRVDGPARVEVTAAGSLAPELVGQVWQVGEGDPVEVAGPDWAVLAWLTGRGSLALDALTAVPELGHWR
ncbi:MAG: maleylpyruvate isomerase [Pseudonocardiales bacterium]|nr:maleylpyruvate isomerase [Pseudonocardiales bacterium]